MMLTSAGHDDDVIRIFHYQGDIFYQVVQIIRMSSAGCLLTSAGYDGDVIRIFIGQTFGIDKAGGSFSDASGFSDEGKLGHQDVIFYIW